MLSWYRDVYFTKLRWIIVDFVIWFYGVKHLIVRVVAYSFIRRPSLFTHGEWDGNKFTLHCYEGP